MVAEKDIQELIKEAIAKAKIEAYTDAIKVMHDAFSRGSFRVIIHNKIVELEKSGEKA